MNTNKTLGIIGGGQLGKMMLQYCSTIGIKTRVYDSSELSVCSDICSSLDIGDFHDYDKLMEFGRKCSIITFEIENICINALEDLEKEGIIVFPKPNILKIIQNKYSQKMFFQQNNIPTCNFKHYSSLCEIKKDILNKTLSLPFVWKKTKAGYDGFGVKIIKYIDELNEIDTIYDSEDSSISSDSSDSNSIHTQECIIEEVVPIVKEISILIARNPQGQIMSYEPLEMVFNNNTNQLDHVFQPCVIPYKIQQKCKEMAKKIVTLFNYVGIMAVEFFYTYNGNVFVNELAPRPHNSGHLTIESCCATSQFEQHIRAVLDMPLGETIFYRPACMFNIVGHPEYMGIANYNTNNIKQLIYMENTYIHIYGKLKTYPNRKLGHITILGEGKPTKEMIQKINEKTKIKSLIKE